MYTDWLGGQGQNSLRPVVLGRGACGTDRVIEVENSGDSI